VPQVRGRSFDATLEIKTLSSWAKWAARQTQSKACPERSRRGPRVPQCLHRPHQAFGGGHPCPL